MIKISDRRCHTFITKEELGKLYDEEKLSVSEICRRLNRAPNTICYWLKKYSIKKRNASESMKLFHNRKELEISTDKLYELYKIKKLSISEIAKTFQCSNATILNRLSRYKIANRFSNCKPIYVSKTELKRLYVKEKLSTYQIADIYKCCSATIRKKLIQFGIKRREGGTPKINVPSRSILKKLYIDEKLSTWDIERKYGYSRSTAHRLLRKYGLVRSRPEAHVMYPRKDFSGNKLEKAYLIGFTLGDLRVRKPWENGETITIDCSSSIPEQIELIKKLFENYGRVWIKDSPTRNNYTQTQVLVNLSFSFLLSKDVPEWILKNKKHFAAFLAGFVDAEGYFSVHGGQAKFGIGNYNKDILFLIHRKLNELKISCRAPKGDHRKGTANAQGYIFNNNYWQLAIHKKSDLLKVFDLLELHIKHEKKIAALSIARENVLERNEKFGSINMPIEVNKHV